MRALLVIAAISGNSAWSLEEARTASSGYLELWISRLPEEYCKGSPVPPIALPDIPAFRPITLQDLPDFQNDIEPIVTKTGKVHTNGLVSTINYEQFKERKAPGELTVIISKEKTGFTKDVKARVWLQPGVAPLGVPLLGFGMLATDKSARAYQADLFNAGNHVLSIDSIISNKMNEATGHGVAGNPEHEAKVMGKLIDAFLATNNPRTGEPFRQSVSSVRLLGTSWGGLISMHVLRLPQAAKWPIDRALIVSMPVSLDSASDILDRCHRVDLVRTSTMQLAKMMGGYTPKNADPDERECTWMRAGLGYSFYGDLKELAKSNIERYMPALLSDLKMFHSKSDIRQAGLENLRLLKERHEVERQSLNAQKNQFDKATYQSMQADLKYTHKSELEYASKDLTDVSNWSFKHYVYLLDRHYWHTTCDVSNLGMLTSLLQGGPNFVQVVFAEDDPINNPEEVANVKKMFSAPQMIVLPHGGHLGFNGTTWFQAMTAKFFAVDGPGRLFYSVPASKSLPATVPEPAIKP